MRFVPTAFRGISVPNLRDAWRLFRPAFEGLTPAIVLSVVLAIGVAALELVRPWPLKLVFDHVLAPDPVGVGERSTGAILAAAALLTLAISASIGTLSLRATIAAAQVNRKLTTRVRRQLFQHLNRLAFPFHQSSRTGDLLVRVMGDVNAVRDALFASWVNLLSRGLLFAGTAVVMFVLEPLLALLALLPLPLLAVLMRDSSRKLRAVAKKQRGREGDAASFAAETLRQIRVVKAYAAEGRLTSTFDEEARSAERAGARAARIAARMERATEILTGAGLALVLFVGAHFVIRGRLTAGSLLVFLSYARSMYKPLRKMSGEGTRLSKASACLGRVLEVLRLPPEDYREGWRVPKFRGSIDFRSVSYRHPDGHVALRDVSFQVDAGSLVVLSGPNGSGKTTILSILLRLISPDSGSVLIDLEPIDRFRLGSYRSRFAYVPQEIQLFGATVRENILYGRPDANDDQVEEAARQALIHDVIVNLPRGYETVLGEDGATLSGGEGRRLMLARAALRRSRILLLDEPLAGLDPSARRVVAQAIRRIAAGRTTLVVSHGPMFEIEADVGLRIEAGRVVEREDLAERRSRAMRTLRTRMGSGHEPAPESVVGGTS